MSRRGRGVPTAVAAAAAKSGTAATLPIHADLAARLRDWFAERDAARGDAGPAADAPAVLAMGGADADAPLWPGRWCGDRKAAPMLRGDLEAAGVAYRDAAGGVLDFHALRHTFITNVVASGANVKDAQALARHSSAALTLDRYAHGGGLRDADAALSRLSPLPAGPAAVRATGTDARDAAPRGGRGRGRGEGGGLVAGLVAGAAGNPGRPAAIAGNPSTAERYAAGGRTGGPAAAGNAAPPAWGAAKEGAGVSERRPEVEGWYTGLEPATSGITIRRSNQLS